MGIDKINNKITISFTKSDDDIIEYVEGLKTTGKASEFIREAIREKIERTGANEEFGREILGELAKLTQKVEEMAKNRDISESKRDTFSDGLLVRKENRFGSVVFKEKESN